MDLEFTETERLGASVAREMLDAAVTTERLAAADESETGLDPELWKRITDLGWTSLTVPEPAGGAGAGFVQTGLILEELGRSGAGTPLTATALTAALLAQTHPAATPARVAGARDGGGSGATGVVASTAPRASGPAGPVLHAVAAGAVLAAVGVAPESGGFVARPGGAGGLVLDGGPDAVPWAHLAEHLLVLARLDGSASTVVCLVDPRADGVSVTAARGLDNERLGVVRLAGVAAGEPVVTLDGDRALDEWLTPYLALHAAVALGGARRLLEITVEYVSMRRQFGRALGSLPTVQQACADMAIEIDGAALSTYDALSRLDAGAPASATAAIAAYWTGVAGQNAAIRAAQLHGAIGFMKEYHFQYFFRRAKAAQIRLGSLRWQRERLARLVLPPVAAGDRRLWIEGPEPRREETGDGD